MYTHKIYERVVLHKYTILKIAQYGYLTQIIKKVIII